jgi:Lrp/AsnC family transcriptional regulator, regulator for asnA, asnC and gidA
MIAESSQSTSMEERFGTPAPSGLDAIDQHIVRTLERDGRANFAQMAKQLDVSPGTIRTRYGRLVDRGYLKVVALTNPQLMGYDTMAVIGIRADGGRLLEVAERMASLDEVIYLVVVSGHFDIIAEVACRDRAHLLRFLTEELHGISGVRETESFMHLRIVKELYF